MTSRKALEQHLTSCSWWETEAADSDNEPKFTASYSAGDPISETFSPHQIVHSGELGSLMVTPRGTVCLSGGWGRCVSLLLKGCLDGQDLVKLGAAGAKGLLSACVGG